MTETTDTTASDTNDQVIEVPQYAHAHEPADDLDELDDFVPEPPHRFGRATLALAAALLIAAGFFGGVLVQKNHGKSGTAATGTGGNAALRRAFAAGEGFPAGGFGGFGGGAGSPGGGANVAGGAGSNSTSGTSTQLPVVIGRVTAIKGGTVTVTNLGGRAIAVTVTAATAITTRGLNGSLQVGNMVSVYGTSANGAVAATAITVR